MQFCHHTVSLNFFHIITLREAACNTIISFSKYDGGRNTTIALDTAIALLPDVKVKYSMMSAVCTYNHKTFSCYLDTFSTENTNYYVTGYHPKSYHTVKYIIFLHKS